MMFRFALLSTLAVTATGDANTIEIAPGVQMPRVNLGTCCGSESTMSPANWLAAGGRGIDTALDYGKGVVPGGTQAELAAALNKVTSVQREDLFITTKIPAGYGVTTGFCQGGAAKALKQVKQDIRELTSTPDLILLHAPCPTDEQNFDMWQGLEQALKFGYTRAIGVSNFGPDALKALYANATVKPAVNQCLMSVGSGTSPNLESTLALGVVFEAYEALHGCPFKNTDVQAIAKTHGTGIPNVCLRWVLQKGGALAVGLGMNATKQPRYAAGNLDVFGFQLTDDEMAKLDAIGIQPKMA